MYNESPRFALKIMINEYKNINEYFVLIGHKTWMTTILKSNEMNANPGVLQRK